MAIRRGPWNVVASDNISDTANTLRDLANELESDPRTLGAVIVIIKEGRSEESHIITTMGKIRRSKESAFFALHRAAALLIYNR